MPLFTLKAGYTVETTATGGRVIHNRTGDSLELTFTEVQLLARAAAGGLETSDPAIRPVVARLATLGLLQKSAGPAKPEAPQGAKTEPGLWLFPAQPPETALSPVPLPAAASDALDLVAQADEDLPTLEPEALDSDPLPSQPPEGDLGDLGDPVAPVLETIGSEMPVMLLSEAKRMATRGPAPEPAPAPAPSSDFGPPLDFFTADDAAPAPDAPAPSSDFGPPLDFFAADDAAAPAPVPEPAPAPADDEAEVTFEMLPPAEPSPAEAPSAIDPASAAVPLPAPDSRAAIAALFDEPVPLPAPTPKPGPEAAPEPEPAPEPGLALAAAGEPEEVTDDDVQQISTSAAAAAPALAPDAPAPSPDELAPAFRADLKLIRKPPGGLFDVTDPASGKTFAFYDFELSISRMLNGRRTYKEVVDSANRLGIPVSHDSLVQFVRQVERYGFLAPKGTAHEVPPEGSIWGKREDWDESVRTLFQSGLRLARQGRYHEALAYFEAILENDPQNPEATEMVEQTKYNISKEGAQVEADKMRAAVAAEPLVIVPPSRTGFWVAGAVLLAGAALALGFHFGAQRGTVVSPGPTPNPDLLPAVAVAPDAASAAAAAPDAASAAESAAPDAAELAAADSGAVPLAVAAVAGADAAVAADLTPAAGAGWITLEIAKRGRVTMGEIRASAAGTVGWAAAPQEKIRKGQVVGRLSAGGKDEPLAAPKAGLLVPKIPEGGAAQANDLLAAIVYHEAFLQAHYAGADHPAPSWGCEIVDDTGQRAPCKVVQAQPYGTGLLITATTEPTWVDTATKARLRLQPAP